MKASIVGKLGRSVSKRFNRLFGRFLRIDRDNIGAAYLSGEGLEIGALHNPLKVPRGCTVRYVDNIPADEARRRFSDVSTKRLVGVDILDDGERLDRVPDGSQDFVIANHFIEHCQNPIGAVRNMIRVLRAGGVLYLAIPDKRYTFDRDRPSTAFEHLLRDDREGPSWSRRQHLEEWVRVVEGISDDASVNGKIDELLGIDCHIHYHVWNQAEQFQLVCELRAMLGFEIELTFKRKNETIFVLRKSPPRSVQNA